MFLVWDALFQNPVIDTDFSTVWPAWKLLNPNLKLSLVNFVDTACLTPDG